MQITLKGITLNKLDRLGEYLETPKNAIVNIALFNGIKSLDAGYIPYMPKEKTEMDNRTKDLGTDCTADQASKENKANYTINFRVPFELKETVYKYAKNLGYNKRDFVELLIELECNRLINMFEKYGRKSLKAMLEDENILSSLNIRFNIPNNIRTKMEKNAGMMGISDNQYYRYLLLEGFRSHDNNLFPLTIEKSMMLIDEIERLAIDPVKAWTLINYIIQNSPENKLCSLEAFLQYYLDVDKQRKAIEKRKQKKEKT